MATSDFVVKGNIVINGVTIESDGTALNLPPNTTVNNTVSQEVLVSGTNIKTINSQSILGSGNITIEGNTATATALQTERTFTIGSTGKLFNGTADVAWSLAEIGVNNATLTLATSGIATGSQTFTANQGTAATFTVNVPATNLTYSTAASTGVVNSSTGANATLPAATTTVAGLLTGADKTKLDGIAAGAQVNVATNLGYTTGASTGIVTSSTGANATLPAATTTVAGLLTGADKTKLDGIAAGAQVNVATNLSVTAGTTAGPTINSSTGTNVTFPTASGTASGAVTTGNQTIAGIKTFSTAVAVTGTSKAAGQLYAGATNPSNTTRLNYDGNLHVNELTAVGNVTAFSDARLKTDLVVISDALKKVHCLTGYTYTRIDSGARHTGLIAQDVQAILPEAVTDNGETLSVAYGNMVGLLVEAVKEMTARLEKMELR